MTIYNVKLTRKTHSESQGLWIVYWNLDKHAKLCLTFVSPFLSLNLTHMHFKRGVQYWNYFFRTHDSRVLIVIFCKVASRSYPMSGSRSLAISKELYTLMDWWKNDLNKVIDYLDFFSANCPLRIENKFDILKSYIRFPKAYIFQENAWEILFI